MMRAVIAYLDRLWFAPCSALPLAVTRWLTGGYSAWYLWDHDTYLVRAARGLPATFRPVGAASLLNGPISTQLFATTILVTSILGICFVLGFWHRVLAPLFGLLLLFTFSYSNSWSMIYHTENMLVLHVLVLAISPSASALSIDAILTRRFPILARLGFAPKVAETHLKFRWPLRVLQLGATLPYVVAGMAKLNGASGIHWANGENLRDQITMNGLYYEVLRGGAPPITFHVYGWDTAFMLASVLTLILEIGAPIALLHRYLGYAYVMGIMSMHWSILVLMGIPFPYQLYGAAFACFVEWDRLLPWVHARIIQGPVGRLLARLPLGPFTS